MRLDLPSRNETSTGEWVHTIGELVRIGVVREVLFHPVHALAIQYLYTRQRKATDCYSCEAEGLRAELVVCPCNIDSYAKQCACQSFLGNMSSYYLKFAQVEDAVQSVVVRLRHLVAVQVNDNELGKFPQVLCVQWVGCILVVIFT